MNDKFKYHIVPSGRYNLKWENGESMEVYGQDILNAMWSQYRVEFYLESND